MSIAVIDYGSGNLKSAAKALEVAVNNINLSSKIVVTSDPKTIKQLRKFITFLKANPKIIDNFKNL